MSKIEGMAVVHIMGDGNINYLIAGDQRFRLFVVDERAPHDRVYEMTDRCTSGELCEVLGESQIGHKNDDRHAALEARILEASEGKPRLAVVPRSDD